MIWQAILYCSIKRFTHTQRVGHFAKETLKKRKGKKVRIQGVPDVCQVPFTAKRQSMKNMVLILQLTSTVVHIAFNST